MSLQMALIARLSPRIPTSHIAHDMLSFDHRSSWRHAVPECTNITLGMVTTHLSSDDIPRIMVQPTAAEALDWGGAGSWTNRCRSSVATSRGCSWTESCDVANATTVLEGCYQKGRKGHSSRKIT
jgi:hypothetical protein